MTYSEEEMTRGTCFARIFVDVLGAPHIWRPPGHLTRGVGLLALAPD